jgi:alanine-glyoxylate transaminase/serine-glyoxylate transaminase/serine-pyruvate transaminase
MSFEVFDPPKRVLMGPGPSDVPESVLHAMSGTTIGHLDPAFTALMDQIKELLRYAFQTKNKLTFPVSGPGSVGMETCLINLIEPGDQVVVCTNGVFGSRMSEIVRRCGGLVTELQFEWGRAIDLNKVEDTLEIVDAKVLAFVHAETSTGALSDAQGLCQLAQKHNCLTVVDTVTSLGGSPLYVDDWGMDAVYSGTQKCLSCVPGLSPVTFSEKAIEVIKSRKSPVQSWFMDLNLVMQYWDENAKRSYHHTAPVNSLYALYESLRLLHVETLEKAWKRHHANHLKLKKGLEGLELQFVVPEDERIPQLNAVKIPSGVNDADIRKNLLALHELEIGGGLGAMAGKVWRIGLMGHSSNDSNIELCVNALSEELGA